MKMTAAELKNAGIIEKVIQEPTPADRDDMDGCSGGYAPAGDPAVPETL